MNKIFRISLIFSFILSPLIIGAAISSLQKPNSLYGFAIFFYVIVGIPAIGIIGLLISFLTRKSRNAYFYSLCGYGLPALIVFGFEIFAAVRK